MQLGFRLHRGFTLLETMLVLALSSAILLVSVKQYQSYKIDSDVNQVLYNVDQIFQAASYYYQANCRNQVNSSTGVFIAGSGVLDPLNNPKNPTVVTPLQLLNSHYLSRAVPISPIVVNANNMASYVVQFNLVSPQTQRTVNLSAGGSSNVGKIYIWKIQVAVNLFNKNTSAQYLNLLRGDCLSRKVGTSVTPCPAIAAPPAANATYVVFERLPSFATPQSDTGLYPTNAVNKQFNQQYSTYPILYLTSGVAPLTPQNYLCGT